jgi:predicted ATPase
MEQGLALFTALGNRLMLTVYCAQLAAAKAQAGNLGEAHETLEWCKALMAMTGERFYEPEIHRGTASGAVSRRTAAPQPGGSECEGIRRTRRS